jgi:hypothetical protein
MKNLRKMSLVVVLTLICSILFAGCGKDKNELTKEKQQELAYGAILSTRNNMSFDTLKIGHKGIERVLNDYWEVSDKQSAIETLDWLLNEGHRIDADVVFQEIKNGTAQNYEELKSIVDLCNKAKSTMESKLGFTEEMFNNVNTVAAWDFDRLVTVARWCYSAEYISEEEAWSYIEKAASMAKESFNSWEEYYISFAYGRAIAYEGDIDDIINAGETLFKESGSVWKEHSFK